MRSKRLLLVSALAIVSVMAQDFTAKVKTLVKEKKYDEAVKLLDESGSKVKAGAANQPLADAHVLVGNSMMYDDALPPFKKYPSALREFRKALKYDKNNAKAKTNIDTIEGIYKSMGRPVPQ